MPNILVSLRKPREVIYVLYPELKRKLALEASMVVVASRMLMKELQGHTNVVKVILGLIDFSRNSGKNEGV